MSSLHYQLNDATVEIQFSFDKGYPATFDDPGCDDEVEISAVIYEGINIIATISPEAMCDMESYILKYEPESDL